MGSTMDFISATLTDAVAPKFRRPVEDIIYETIDRKQIPTRTDFQELRNTIDALRSQSTGTSSGIIKIKNGLDELEELVHDLQNTIVDLSETVQTLSQQNQALVNRIDNLGNVGNTEVTSDVNKMLQQVIAHNKQLEQENRTIQNTTSMLLQRLEQLEAKQENIHTLSNTSKKASKKEALSEKTTADKTKSCTIDGCAESARGFGFCNKHYNKWRRYTLGNFVTYEATVRWQDQIITVPDIYKGKPFTVNTDNSIWVEGEQIGTL